MIPKRYIEEWKVNAPWPLEAQTEQDLIIERALVEIFTDKLLFNNLAFRGGTALHKFFLNPQVRYSEDIDLVQIEPIAIGEVLSRLRKNLSFLGKAKLKQHDRNNTLLFRFFSETPPVIKMRLKIEINCREHITILGFKKIEHRVINGWFNGGCEIKSFLLEELLGTKLRALYQRKKGRDLFDLDYALKQKDVDSESVVNCFIAYMVNSGEIPPTRRQFILNLEKKLDDKEFIRDTFALLKPGNTFDIYEAYANLRDQILDKL